MWTYKTIWNISISDFTVASPWLTGLLNQKKETPADIHKNVCHRSHKYIFRWTKKYEQTNCLIVNVHLLHIVQFTLQNGTSEIFSFVGSLSHADKWHYHSGPCFKDVSVLLHRHIHQGRLLPLWLIGSSKPRWPLTPPYNNWSVLVQVL